MIGWQDCSWVCYAACGEALLAGLARAPQHMCHSSNLSFLIIVQL